MPDSVLEGFEKETGIHINQYLYSSNEDMLAKVRTENEGTYDILQPTDYMVISLIAQELLEPLGDNSPIAKVLEKSPDGGIHHICYEVDDILAARDRLKAQGARVLGSGEPRIGAHGKPVLFLHPKDFLGTLVELEQA